MTTASSPLVRSLLIYSICLPLAVILGYMLANPLDPTTFGVVGLVLFLLLTPALLRWHHTWLIATWNAGRTTHGQSCQQCRAIARRRALLECVLANSTSVG